MDKKGVESYFQEFMATLKTPGTRKQYRFDILEFCGGSLPVDVVDLQGIFTEDNVLAYVNRLKKRGKVSDKGLKPVTINRKLVPLRRFALYLQGKGLLVGDPTNPYSVPREKCEKWAPRDLMTPEDIKKILSILKKQEPNEILRLRDELFIKIGYCTLLHRSAIANLSLEDIVSVADIFVLNIRISSGPDFIVPFPEDLKKLFDTYWKVLRGDVKVNPDNNGRVPILVSLSNRTAYQRISENYLNQIIKRRVRQANLPVSIHTATLRQSGIAYLLQNGTPVSDVEQLAGLKNYRILRVFEPSRIISLVNSTKKLLDSICTTKENN